MKICLMRPKYQHILILQQERVVLSSFHLVCHNNTGRSLYTLNSPDIKTDYRIADVIVVWSSFGSILIPFGYLVTCPTYFGQVCADYLNFN